MFSTDPTTRETADHAELVWRLREDADWQRKMKGGTTNDRMLDQAADALETLLSEIAALRGEQDRLKLAICGGEDVPGAIDAVTVDDCDGFIREERQRHDGLLTQAERQRDELRKALGDVLFVRKDNPKASDRWMLEEVHRISRIALANQGADQ